MGPLVGDTRVRLLVLGILAVAVIGLLGWAGTLTPNPDMNNFPGNDEIGPNPEVYLGDRVSIGGTVVATDPVVIEIEYGGDATRDITLVTVERSVDPGEDVSAFGTLTDPGTLAVERILVRSPWERYVMYGISAIAGLWVLGRLYLHWHLDPATLTVDPRGDGDA